MERQIPVTILTGFLGAGKTTVLNRLLAMCDGLEVGVIENELGDIGIDNQLVQGVAEELLQLSNGCMCCTVRGDLVRILRQWVSEGRRLDRIIVETSGIANPGPIAETFAADPVLRDRFAVEAIVAIVDARHGPDQIGHIAEAHRQIAYADRILVSKADLVEDAAIGHIEREIRAINPLAMLRIKADAARDSAFVLRRLPPAEAMPVPTPHGHHHSGISAASVCLPGLLNGPRFYRWMGDLLAFSNDRLYRSKGILAIEGQPRRVILQGVRDLLDFTLGAPWREDERPFSQLVLIGKGMAADRYEPSLHECLAREPA